MYRLIRGLMILAFLSLSFQGCFKHAGAFATGFARGMAENRSSLPQCPDCSLSLHRTGETKFVDGELKYVYACVSNHRFLGEKNPVTTNSLQSRKKTSTVQSSTSNDCPTCGLNMIWTGKTKTEWGKLRYLHRCVAGHEYYFDGSSGSSRRKSATSNKDACPVCGMSTVFTGRTYSEWGKLHYVHRCPAGHESVKVK